MTDDVAGLRERGDNSGVEDDIRGRAGSVLQPRVCHRLHARKGWQPLYGDLFLYYTFLPTLVDQLASLGRDQRRVPHRLVRLAPVCSRDPLLARHPRYYLLPGEVL